MCGIFALFLKRPLDEADIALGRAGRDALAHRGPDGVGEWLDRAAGVYLGHRRLAIIDPTPASDQPLRRDGWVIACNGEVYNYPELRGELERCGHGFLSAGDVEVLLAAWMEWGEQALDRVDAMFAFAVWDGRRAHVAVDPFGEKPLYYAETKDGVYLSSEIGPLAQLLDLTPELKGENLAAFLSFGYVPPPATAYRQVSRVDAATKITIENGAIVATRRYWTVPAFAPKGERAAPLSAGELDRLNEALIDSVRGRLLADVPLCLFLSSGVDSALVAAIASRELGASPRCVTVSFPRGQTADESADAAAIAAHLDLDHRVIESDDAAAAIGPDAVLDLFGQPCESLTSLSVHQMCRAAARSHKVGLTGSGGDEIFMGYGKHAHFFRFRRLYGMPEPVRLLLGNLARPLAGRSARLQRLGYDFGVRDCERYVAQKTFPTIGWLRKLDDFQAWCSKSFGDEKAPLEYLVAGYEITMSLPGLRLVAMDVGSMRAGVELRTPYLSRALVETIAEMDPRAFFAFGQKHVLRQLLARYLPAHLFDRPKRGFVFPQDLYLERYGNGVPEVPGVADHLVEEVWRRRNGAEGWRRSAVRLVSLGRFMGRHGAGAGGRERLTQAR